MKKVLFILFLLLAFPTAALAAGDEPAKYVIPELFAIALLGFGKAPKRSSPVKVMV